MLRVWWKKKICKKQEEVLPQTSRSSASASVRTYNLTIIITFLRRVRTRSIIVVARFADVEGREDTEERSPQNDSWDFSPVLPVHTNLARRMEYTRQERDLHLSDLRLKRTVVFRKVLFGGVCTRDQEAAGSEWFVCRRNSSKSLTFKESIQRNSSRSLTFKESIQRNSSKSLTFKESIQRNSSKSLTFKESIQRNSSKSLTFKESIERNSSKSLTFKESIQRNSSKSLTFKESIQRSASWTSLGEGTPWTVPVVDSSPALRSSVPLDHVGEDSTEDVKIEVDLFDGESGSPMDSVFVKLKLICLTEKQELQRTASSSLGVVVVEVFRKPRHLEGSTKHDYWNLVMHTIREATSQAIAPGGKGPKVATHGLTATGVSKKRDQLVREWGGGSILVPLNLLEVDGWRGVNLLTGASRGPDASNGMRLFGNAPSLETKSAPSSEEEEAWSVVLECYENKRREGRSCHSLGVNRRYGRQTSAGERNSNKFYSQEKREDEGAFQQKLCDRTSVMPVLRFKLGWALVSRWECRLRSSIHLGYTRDAGVKAEERKFDAWKGESPGHYHLFRQSSLTASEVLLFVSKYQSSIAIRLFGNRESGNPESIEFQPSSGRETLFHRPHLDAYFDVWIPSLPMWP
ncbi:unnamed protein product [Cyprideis torosa]|uniref:Uncharacterized protein n=1 Tax=Cyprideis torosa TaxID=163714 RepID=A0A7R8ZID3_9CRUS|nr:unnamed protein product [Cyprideis torosa]CAG0879694.1 unnamed protein product [Cyprideis torosa]